MSAAAVEPWRDPLGQLVRHDVDRILRSAAARPVGEDEPPPPALVADMRRDLTARAVTELMHLLAAEVARRRARGQQGDDARGCWAEAVGVVERAGLRGLFRGRYDAGLRRVERLLERRARFLRAVWRDLRADADALARFGAPVTDAERIRLLDTGSDPHDGQRTALHVTIGPRRVVYKPRALAADRLLHDAFRLIEAAAGRRLFRAPALLDRGDHGWMEYLPHVPLQSSVERTPYLERCGSLLAVAWLLETTDLHAENLISQGSWPVVVDAETVLQPSLRIASDQSLGADARTFSVLDTHLLPAPETRDGGSWDTSGLAGTAAAMTNLPDPVVLDAGSDRFTIAWGRQRLPRFGVHPGLVRDPGEDALALGRGFVVAVEAGRDAAPALRRLIADATDRGVRPRVIVRSTAAYHRKLLRARSPRFAERDRDHEAALVFEAPASDVATASVHQGLLEEELASLRRGDVPRFQSPLGTDRLEAVDGGPVVAGAVSPHPPGVAPDPRRADQESAVAALSLRIAVPAASDARRRDTSGTGGSGPRDGAGIRPLHAVRRAVDHLRAHGLLPTDPAGPLYGLQLDPQVRIRRLGSGFHRGVLGVGVFLAALARVDPSEREWATALLATLHRRLRAGRWRDLAPAAGILDGAAGALHAVTLIDRIRPGTISRAAWQPLRSAAIRELREELRREVATPDVATGIAGSVWVLLGQVSRIRTAARAVDDGVARLLAMQDSRGGWRDREGRLLCGAAHGAAGIAAVLAMARGRSSRRHAPRLDLACEAAVEFEAGAYLRDRERWRDARLDPAAQATALNGWCTGAAGILLARTALLRVGATAVDAQADVGRALGSLQSNPPSNDRLCCGSAGVVDVLHSVRPRATLPPDRAEGGRLEDVLTASVEALAWRAWSGGLRLEHLDDPVLAGAVPGILRGVTGPLYALLRHEDPSLPSLLEPLWVQDALAS